MPAPRRRKIGHRRRVEDEADDDGRPDALDLDDDSLTEGSLTDDDDAGQDSDTSNIDEASPTTPNASKATDGPHPKSARTSTAAAANGNAKQASDTEMMLHGLSIARQTATPQEMQFDEVVVSPPKSPSAPVVVSSASAMRQQPANHVERRRQEHEDYKRRRDEDPAFVPNRGSFFMHDHRHAGPAANGFRPFGRGRGRGGRYGVGGPFAPFSHMQQPSDPTTNSQWTHDMHDSVADSVPRRPRQMPDDEGPPNGNGFIPTCEPSATPINRTLSTEKHIGNAQVRVMLPGMMEPAVFPGMPVKQYTKLPDHRPPLRRDKPVRISLPGHPPRYIFPASDRSFTFIPRALRPNQQRMRGKSRSAWGSIGGFSRRTSVFGGSYYGSAYSPSVALSRRSSVAHERDFIFSPTATVISRPPMPTDNVRPVVRLPPSAMPQPPMPVQLPAPGPAHVAPPAFGQDAVLLPVPQTSAQSAAPAESSINELPPPQTHPLPQKPTVQENRPNSIPMHQPRPQKNISVADIESPTMTRGVGSQAFQGAFHQQVPVQVANGYGQEAHARRPSFPSQQSTGTPLSHIPERAIHAAPFQPNAYGQPQYYGQQVYQPQPQQGYFYATGYSGPGMAPTAPAPGFVPAGQPANMPGGFAPQGQPDQGSASLGHGHNPSAGSNLVAQEVNGMVYYYDASQIAPVNSYPTYSAPQGYQPSVMGMGGMVTPSPDGFYYPQHASGMVYYPQ
ncbi:extensin [Metarhizium album ARSEF 1941]|uniref:Extensin n=1 Tax=Metarhizium album (strain ARSEF 1941) TaxID=1081103 RepID=A0A0B2WLA3_METAS|nr:extensin [Metarhizium album ARSEF 1941]KHN93785.1 extensin [Metarhizium album ARSEF 1941]